MKRKFLRKENNKINYLSLTVVGILFIGVIAFSFGLYNSGVSGITGFSIAGFTGNFLNGTFNEEGDLTVGTDEFLNFIEEVSELNDSIDSGSGENGSSIESYLAELFDLINSSNSSLPNRGSGGGSSKGGTSGGGASGEGGRVTIPAELLPFFNKFRGGDNTNWDSVGDISSVCNPIIEIPGVGRIRWKGCVDARGANFDTNINITGNFINVNSSSLDSSFNSPAEVTFVGLNYSSTPVLYRNGVLCTSPQCTVREYLGGELLFDVLSFSSYTTGPNSLLEIWDETDGDGKPYSGQIRNPLEDTFFFANYSNTTSGGPILSATCFINFTDSSSSMTYNSISLLYQYDRTFSTEGLFDFNVTCNSPSFEELATDDFTDIHNNFILNGPNGASVAVGSSSRGTADAAFSSAAYSGNITDLTINGNSITQSWQGYVGNVSGVISLENAAGDILYNWSSQSPEGEVYASRTSGVDFSDISCANSTEIFSEESFVGQQTSDVDSFNNTFNLNSHPGFFVGATEILTNTCNSTNLFDEGGPQSLEFYEVLLADSVSRIVYTSILESNELGFDSRLHDFEMIVGDDGHGTDLSTTTYYFYMELS